MADDVWEEFRRTYLRITVPGGHLDVRPRHDRIAGAYIDRCPGPIHVLTAHNPMGIAAEPDTNTAANRRLARELSSTPGLSIWPATGHGGGPVEAGETWSEAGFAVFGLDRPRAIDLAIRFRQRAIFEWRNEPGGFRLVACDGSADEPRGWESAFASTRA